MGREGPARYSTLSCSRRYTLQIVSRWPKKGRSRNGPCHKALENPTGCFKAALHRPVRGKSADIPGRSLVPAEPKSSPQITHQLAQSRVDLWEAFYLIKTTWTALLAGSARFLLKMRAVTMRPQLGLLSSPWQHARVTCLCSLTSKWQF